MLAGEGVRSAANNVLTAANNRIETINLNANNFSFIIPTHL
jgi:hypothetical protein